MDDLVREVVAPAPRRRLAVWGLVALLGALALLSALGLVATALERRGLIALHRQPFPILHSWTDDVGHAVAIVNTDTEPGSFLLGFEVPPEPLARAPSEIVLRWGFLEDRSHHPSGHEVRVWVPARSIVLRTDPRLEDRDCTVWLYGAHESVGNFQEDDKWRAVPLGTRTVLTWKGFSRTDWSDEEPPDGFYTEIRHPCEGVRIVQRPGVQFEKETTLGDWFRWDGRTAVAVDFVSGTPRGFAYVFAVAVNSKKGSVGSSEHVWAYPSDMTV